MPIRDTSTAFYTSGTSRTVTVPAGASVGDLATLLVGISNSNIANDLSTNGWTLHGFSEPTSTGGELYVWTKELTVTDIGADVTLETGSSTRWAMAVLVHYGVTGLDAAPAFSTSGSTTPTPTAPSITTVTPGAELYSVYGVHSYGIGALISFTFPSGQTEVLQGTSTSTSFRNSVIGVGTEIVAIPGPTGDRVATTTETSGDNLSDRVSQGTVSLAYTADAVPPTVKVRQSGAWSVKPLRARVGGTWV